MTIETEKAISLKRLVGSVKLSDIPATGTLWLFAVVGVCTGVKTRMGDAGEQKSYVGDFIAKTMVPGKADAIKTVRADALFLPNAGDDMMEEAGVTTDAEGAFYDMGLKVGATRDAKGRVAYAVEWLQKPTASSPAEALVKRIAPDMLGEATAPQTPAAPAKKK